MIINKFFLNNNVKLFFFLIIAYFILELSSANAQCLVNGIHHGGCTMTLEYSWRDYKFGLPSEIIVENRNIIDFD